MVEAAKKYIVIVQLRSDSDIQRIANDCPKIIELIKGMCRNDCEQVFRSPDGTLFAYFVKTSSPSVFFRAEFEKHHATTNDDKIIVLEVGEDFSAIGFSRAWTWLQHR
ncbi:hypothetical protein [Oceanibaculum indicum]|uniref:hypothetical protein n=1 Tax=Oceanibaculum indicum TaxID=526216 RepID=UPI0011C3911B|nr:hypothetical protein [Oceanibaculum indicum]